MDTIRCPICFNDTSSYVILSCNHKVCVSCFINMINGDDYRCMICRDRFFQSSNTDDEMLSDDIEQLRDRIHTLEYSSLVGFLMNEDNQPLLIILFLLYIILVKI